MKKQLFLILAPFFVQQMQAQTGIPVPGFGTNGTQNTLFNTLDKGHRVLQQPDGKILVAGYSNTNPGTLAMARYLANGNLDPSFDGDGKLTIPFTVNGLSVSTANHALALQQDGKILVSGDAYGATTIDFTVFRFLPNGSLDTGFDTDGKAQVNFGTTNVSTANDIAIDASGRIVLAGIATISSKNQFAVARLLPNGSPDNSFNGNGKQTFPIGGDADRAYGLALQSDGKIVLGGTSSNGIISQFALARLLPNGGLDPSFDTDGFMNTGIDTHGHFCRNVAVQPDGKILAGGSCYGTANGGFSTNFALIRVLSNGSLDPSFGTNGKRFVNLESNQNNDNGSAMLLQPDGKILMTGSSFIAPFFYPRVSVIRLLSDGTLDPTFGTNGAALISVLDGGSYGTALCLLQNGTVMVTGHTQSNTTNNTHFALVNLTTGLPVAIQPVRNQLFEVDVFPNPAEEDIWVRFSDGRVLVEEVLLFNGSGSAIRMEDTQALPSGNGIFHFRLPSRLPAGLYTLRIRTTDAGTVSRRILVKG
jgi:uncharacterized delta-60 repeat protein